MLAIGKGDGKDTQQELQSRSPGRVALRVTLTPEFTLSEEDDIYKM